MNNGVYDYGESPVYGQENKVLKYVVWVCLALLFIPVLFCFILGFVYGFLDSIPQDVMFAVLVFLLFCVLILLVVSIKRLEDRSWFLLGTSVLLVVALLLAMVTLNGYAWPV